MKLVGHVPPRCSGCGKMSAVPVAVVQEQSLLICVHCGARIGIDKDAVSRLLAALEASDPPPHRSGTLRS